MNLNLNLPLNPLDLDLVQTAMSYWTGALSEPVPIIDHDDMALAMARGAIVWDLRPKDEFERSHDDQAVSLGGVEWLLAEPSGGNLIPAHVIADALGKVGIHRGCEVVVYAERHAVGAFVALRALRSIGVADARICLGGSRAEAAHRHPFAAATHGAGSVRDPRQTASR